jgi:hypothetical protein
MPNNGTAKKKNGAEKKFAQPTAKKRATIYFFAWLLFSPFFVSYLYFTIEIKGRLF